MKRFPYRIPLAALALALALAPAAASGQDVVVDSLVPMRADARVEIHNANGSVRVGTWDRAAVRVVARSSRPVPVRIDPGGATLVIHTPSAHQRPSVAYEVTVPRAADVEVHGQNSPVTVTEAGGRVQVHTLNGGVTVRGGRGHVELHSVNGPIEVTGTRGTVAIHTVNDAAILRDVVGDVTVATVNGRVSLERVDSRRVEATNVQGSIVFVGPIHPDGVYRLSSHNGGVAITLPCDASARITASTYNGTLQSDCPVTLQEGPRARRFDITLGAGEAQIVLTSFNGKIELRRP